MEPSVVRRAALFGAVLKVLAPCAAMAQAVPVVRAPAEPSDIDPAAPLAALPDLGLDSPDLAAAPGADTPAAQAAADTRYRWRIDGIDGIGSDLFRQRFRELSVLAQNEGKETNPAQLDRRAREDAELLVTLLRSEGYYDAAVTTTVETREGRPTVVLAAEPGGLYRFAGVTIAGVEAAGTKAGVLRDAFTVKPEDPANADIAAAEASLRARVGEEGFPFATVGDPEIVVDRAARTATLTVAVAPRGGWGGSSPRRATACSTPAMSRGSRGSSPGRYLHRVRARRPQARADPDRTRVHRGGRAGAGRDAGHGRHPLPARPRAAAHRGGRGRFGTGEGARVELSWTHRNLFPPRGSPDGKGRARHARAARLARPAPQQLQRPRPRADRAGRRRAPRARRVRGRYAVAVREPGAADRRLSRRRGPGRSVPSWWHRTSAT
ncbi:POTRA domain-containing protein [Sphingomonas sp. MMS24-JH45]